MGSIASRQPPGSKTIRVSIRERKLTLTRSSGLLIAYAFELGNADQKYNKGLIDHDNEQ